MFFSSALQSLPLELRISILYHIKKKAEIEYHSLRMEADPFYVLERMGLKFLSWKTFYYRGHIFTAQKIFSQPEYEEDSKYGYTVRLGIARKDDIPSNVTKHYDIYTLSRETTKTYSSEFSFDSDRCNLENLIPLLEKLMSETPMEERDYDIEYEFEGQDKILKLLDQCSVRTPIDVIYTIRSILNKDKDTY